MLGHKTSIPWHLQMLGEIPSSMVPLRSQSIELIHLNSPQNLCSSWMLWVGDGDLLQDTCSNKNNYEVLTRPCLYILLYWEVFQRQRILGWCHSRHGILRLPELSFAFLCWTPIHPAPAGSFCTHAPWKLTIPVNYFNFCCIAIWPFPFSEFSFQILHLDMSAQI